MAFSEDLLAQRNKLEHDILALESTLGNGSNAADLLSSDSDSAEESEDSGHAGEDVAHEDLDAERQQIQREIEELERTLGADAALVDALTDSEQGSLADSNGEDSDDDLDLPQDLETCLQMNLVYQEVLKEKLDDLDRLLNENREQQKELEEQLSGPSYINPGLPHLKLFLGSFMKPYFKDKLTGLGPPANEETKERLAQGTKPCDEMKIRRWEPWQKALLINSVVTDTKKRMLQPKLSKMEYLTAKMSKAKAAEKQELEKQIALLEKDITEIRSMTEDQLYGGRHDDHDWDKISNIDFEGLRQPDDLMRFWQNYLHPSIDKSTWDQDEIAKLGEIAEKYKWCHWDEIAESLGTGRTAFMCFQTYQRYIAKQFRKREWTKEEDQVFRELVDKMRIGNFIPYTQISYFMEGRESAQLNYRWTCVLDPSIKKGPWTKEEDELLLNAVKKYGCKEWWKIKLEVPGRTDNSCRERYVDCLQTDIKRGAWSDEEVELLKKLVEKYGVGKWAKIASEIPNRLDSQCLNKWKWMMHIARNGVKRRRRSTKHEPHSKRRRMKEKTFRKDTKNEDYDFHTESDSSEDENEQVPYLDSDGEQPVENVFSGEDCRLLEYVQPDMKEWIPARGNKLVHSPGNLRTMLVRLPNEAEKRDRDCVRNTVLDRSGNPVKTYVGMTPPALQKCNSSNEHSMIMVYECDIKRLLIYMGTSVMQMRKSKNKTSLSSCTNDNCAKNDEKEDKCEMESSQKRKRVRRPVTTTQLSYNLMLAITPWIGNVVMPLPFNERRVCEADIVQKRAADVPLQKSPVFLLLLQALKVDTDGCKKVIDTRNNNKVSLTPGPGSRPYSARKPTLGSYRYVKTVSDVLAERTQHKERSRPRQSPEILEVQQLPQPTQTAVPLRSQQQRIAKQKMQFSSQKVNATMILPQTFVVTQPSTDKVGTSRNVVQGLLPLLQLGTQDASKISRPESGTETKQASCPSTSVSTSGPPTETLEEDRTPKRKHKPTMKAQALMDNKRAKRSKKQAAQKQQNSSVTQTVAVLPQTTAWILTPAGLMPVTEIQVKAPGIPDHQNQVMPNNVQIVFQSPVIVKQSSCVAPTSAMKPSNSTPDFPSNNNISLTAGSNIDQNCRPSSVSDKHIVSSLPSSSDFPSDNSAAVTNIPSVSEVLPDTKLPTSIAVSTAQVPSSETACNQNKPVMPMNLVSSLVPVSSSPMRTSQNLTSCISGAATNVPSVSSVSAVTSTPSIASGHPLNISGPGTIPDPQRKRLPDTKMVFKQPIIVNQIGSLALNTAGPCLPNAHPVTTGNITSTSTNSTAPDINKSLPTSSNKGSLVLLNTVEPCPIKNAPATANATGDPPNSTSPNINKSHPASSTEGSLVLINTAGPCLTENVPPTATAKVTRVPPNSTSPNIDKSHPASSTEGSLALINTAGPCLTENAPPTAKVTRVPPFSAEPINKNHPTSTVGPAMPSYVLIPTFVPSSALNGRSNSVPQSGFVNVCDGVNVGSLPTDRLGVNPPISPMTTNCQILPQIVVQQMVPQAKKQTVQRAAITSKQMMPDPSLMFFEQPAQVKNWIKGNGGISLPGLEGKMPYLPPFVSSINTLTTLLKGRDSLLKSSVQLLPEEHRESSEEEAKIAAVRKLVSERFKNNQAYLLLKARFLSCFTLPALLATINPCTESTDVLDQENNMDKVEPNIFGDDQ